MSADEGYGHTLVTADDGLGDPETVRVKDDFVILCDGDCYLDGVIAHSNGTVQLTVKKGKDPDARFGNSQG